MISVTTSYNSFEICVLPTTDSLCSVQGCLTQNFAFSVNLIESLLFKLCVFLCHGHHSGMRIINFSNFSSSFGIQFFFDKPGSQYHYDVVILLSGTSQHLLPQTHKNDALREKCINTEFFLVHIFLYSEIQENTDQKKLCIWTLFTQ